MRPLSLCLSYALLWVQFPWIYLVGLSAENTTPIATSGAQNASRSELVLDCNALNSAAGYGLTWMSSLNEMPPTATVVYSGVGTDEGDNSKAECSFDRPGLCGWVPSGNGSEWIVTSSLDRYLGPILDYRWEGLPDVVTDGSDTLQEAIFVGGGTVSISVRAERDAYILLSSSEDPTSSPTYWIILGGWKNQRSVIRSCPEGVPAKKGEAPLQGCFHRKDQHEEANVLSAWEWRHFVVSVTPEGQVLVNRIGGTRMLNWTDPQPIFSSQGLKRNTSFYLNLRTQDVVGHWKVHNISHQLIIGNGGEVARLFSPTLKVNESNICVTILHFMSTMKNLPRIGLMFNRSTYLKMVAQPHSTDKGWTLVTYTVKVHEDLSKMNVSFVISATASQASPIAIQDLRICPKSGISRIARLRIDRTEVRPNESFTCLPLPYPQGKFILCPPVPIETINGVCVSIMNWKNLSCKCTTTTETCLPPCNVTRDDNSISYTCSPDPKTCSTSVGFTGLERETELQQTTLEWMSTEEISSWTSTEETPQWTTTSKPVTILTDSVRTISTTLSVQNLTVTSRSYSWLKIRWLSPEFNKFDNYSAFIVTWWKNISVRPNNTRQGEKWKKVLEAGPRTMCPKEWKDYYCSTIWNLEPQQNYTITVRPQNATDDSFKNESMTVTSETLEVPWGPSYIFVANRSETTVTLIWGAEIPKNNFSPTHFSIHYRLSQLHSQIAQWTHINILAQNENTNFTHMVSDLIPASFYEFCIHLNNSGGNYEEKNNTNDSTEIKGKHQQRETRFTENLRSACTFTRTLPRKPFIHEGSLLYENCEQSNKFFNVSVTINFYNSEPNDGNRIRAYFLCVTKIGFESRFFDPEVGEELQKELGTKEFYVAAELNVTMYNQVKFTFGDGTETNGSYGNFLNKPLHASDSIHTSKSEIILVAVTGEDGDRRYSWQLAGLPPQCSVSLRTLAMAISGGVFVSFVMMGMIGWIIIRNGHNIRRRVGNYLLQINTFCCHRNDVDNEWTSVKKRARNSMHLEPIPIEPDDQLEYSSD